MGHLQLMRAAWVLQIIIMQSSSPVINPQLRKRTFSERRLIKLEKIGFELQAQRLRKEYSNKHLLREMKMRHRSQGKKLLTEIAQNQVGHFLQPTRIISLTAHKWVIYDYFSGKYIRGYRAKDSHPLSVFSKLLVFCAVNTLLEKYKLDLNRFQTIVSEGVLKLHGVTEGLLKHDDIVSLEDLLHLMIMEESEVYETILAVNVGAFLEKKRQKEYYSVFDANDKHMKQHLKQFYDLVNSYAKLLKLDNIRYVQSQPEARKQKNKCSASDVAVLSIECLKIPFFMDILRKISHTISVKFIDSEGKLNNREVNIKNKAILNKYIPYLSVCRNWNEQSFMDSHCSFLYQNNSEQLRPIVVTLLGCYGPNDREKDIQQVAEWYIKNKNHSLVQIQKSTTEATTSIIPGVKVSSVPQVTSKQLEQKIAKKLNLKPDQPSRYDQGISIKSKNVRIKTHL